ncbi:MAG: glycerophosphodiester phosphodiesterase [Anaerolineae bacterium]|nr:MAG: glycerophosphodiester phosphodiesterase [Anaerolineae bacterium]
MWPDLPTPLIIAHRGASAHAPENTLAAFELAAQQGADAIELDAKLSADGEVVVIHDASVDRTTDGHGRVKDLPLAALRELDAGDGQRIPTLDEVFAAVGHRLYINVELTNYTTPRDALTEKVTALVARHGLQQRVWLSSFYAANLKKAARLLPEVPRALLALPGLPGWWARSFGFAFGDYAALHPHLRDVTPQQVQRVHRLRRRIHVWTVNEPDAMRRLHRWGVDGIFTDDPRLARETLK